MVAAEEEEKYIYKMNTDLFGFRQHRNLKV